MEAFEYIIQYYNLPWTNIKEEYGDIKVYIPNAFYKSYVLCGDFLIYHVMVYSLVDNIKRLCKEMNIC
jgi:hypothetical protein